LALDSGARVAYDETAMAKKDLSKELQELYFPSAKEVVLVDVPKMNFLMIDGKGNPNTCPDYPQAIEALYGVCYTMKFTFEKGHPIHAARVMPLESQWWTKSGLDLNLSKDEWNWTAMIMQPEVITRQAVEAAIEELRKKKNPAALPKLRFESFDEGRSVQIMHIGPYSAEKPTIERMHSFAAEQGYKLRGKHHEIYLGDPRKTKPEKLKTVVRQPVEKN
jgi:hypothetical protein